MVFANSAGDAIVEDIQAGWHVQAWFEAHDGELRVTEVRLRSAGGASTLHGARDRGEPRQNYPHVSGRAMPTQDPPTVDLDRLRDVAEQDPVVNSSLALRGVDINMLRALPREQLLARLAARYVEVIKEPGGGWPFPKLAEEFPYARTTLKDFVAEARKTGLLTKGTSGSAGGELTPKAKRILRGLVKGIVQVPGTPQPNQPSNKKGITR